MSASREKKTRQDLTQQEGYVDAKAKREAEEKRAQRKSSALYLAIAVVFVIVAVILGIVKSGILQKNATALTIDGEKFTPAQVNYFYYTAYHNICNSEYFNYLSLDTDKALDKQTVSEMAKMVVGIPSEGEITWDECLKDIAKENLLQIYLVYQDALKNGGGVNDAVQAELDQSKQALDYYASASGCSTKAYLKRAYGSNMNEKTFDEMLTMCLVAEAHQSDYLNSLTYTDAELEAYYQGDKECFTFADVEYIFFNGVGATTTDAEGNTVAPTDAENAAAAAEAKAAAEDAAQRYSLGESLEDIAADYEEIAQYAHNTEMSSAGSEVTDWAFDAARVEGDTAVLDSSGSQYFVVFHSCGRPEYYTANVRHILFNADTSALDSTSATYDADVEAVWAEARAKAQDALDQWNAGEKTAESFASLANELTDDTGSATTGGLYSDIAKGSSYVPSFKDWCFEEGRKVGDTGIVESTYGCHVMYLDSFSDTLYWKQLVQSEMLDADYADWISAVLADTVAEEGSGMKYVG